MCICMLSITSLGLRLFPFDLVARCRPKHEQNARPPSSDCGQSAGRFRFTVWHFNPEAGMM